MTEHSAQTPDFPNGSIDMNALHDAALAGELAEGMPDHVVLIGENPIEPRIVPHVIADGEPMTVASVEEPAPMAVIAAPLAPTAQPAVEHDPA